jgi:hypothetical protein
MKALNLKPFSIKSALICLLWVNSYVNAYGQAGVNISKPQLRLENDKLIIEYNILSGNPSDNFNVDLRITDSTGAIIKANNLSGDIGDSVGPGFDKTIIWNLAADQIYINTGIFIEVRAEKLIAPAVILTEIPGKQKALGKSKEEKVPEEKIEKKETIPVTEDKVKPVHSAGTGKNLLLSAIVPGWGLTRLSEGKPYWIIAVMDAGCVAAAMYYNNKASSNYTNYLNSSDATKFDPYFEDASKQHTLSKVFGWSAVGIWVADMCLVGIKALNTGRSSKPDKTSYLRIGSYFDYNTSAACLSINFSF